MGYKSVFGPGKGSTIASYTAAVADGVMYPGDCVALSTTAPGSQGASGVFRSQTLGAADYIECSLLDADTAGHEGTALGAVMGKAINTVADWEDVSGDVLADQDVIVIQSWGVHPQVAQLDGGLIGEHLSASATAGECGNAATIVACTFGINLVAASTYTRAAAADTEGAVAFIRVGG